MTDDERDDLDNALSRQLGGAVPGDAPVDADAVLTSVRPRYQRARTRRRVALASGAAALLAIVAVGAVLLTDGSNGKVRVEGTPTSVHEDTSTSSASSSSTSTTTQAPSTSTTTPSNHTGTTTVTTPGGGTTPTTPGTSPSPTTMAPQNKTYTTMGGTVVVHLAQPNVALVSQHANAGYTADVRATGPQEVEVRFSNGQHESRVRVRFHDGRLDEEIVP